MAWSYFDSVEATPGEKFAVELLVDNESGTVTDDLRFGIFESEDNSAWPDKPSFESAFLPATVNAERIVFGWKPATRYFRVGVQSGGVVDTFTVDGWYQGNGVSL